MKNSLFLVLLFIGATAGPISGQGLRGQVLFGDGRGGVASAVVSILNDGGLVAGGLADGQGRFHLNVKPGTYRVRIRVIGSGAHTFESVDVREKSITDVVIDLSGKTLDIAAFEATVGVFGRILDSRTDKPISGVEVTLLAASLATVTDRRGRFQFPDVVSGEDVLRIRHVGYGQNDEPVTIVEGERHVFGFRISSIPVELEGFTVEGEARGFRRGRATRFDGIEGAALDSIRHRVFNMRDILRAANIPGLDVRQVYVRVPEMPQAGFMGMCVEVSRMASRSGAGTCAMVAVYVDGVQMDSPMLSLEILPVENVVSVELLGALVAGARYGDGSGGGVLLITTAVRH